MVIYACLSGPPIFGESNFWLIMSLYLSTIYKERSIADKTPATSHASESSSVDSDSSSASLERLDRTSLEDSSVASPSLA